MTNPWIIRLLYNHIAFKGELVCVVILKGLDGVLVLFLCSPSGSGMAHELLSELKYSQF